MLVWAPLYAMIWLTLAEFLTVMLGPRGSLATTGLHAALGLAIVALAVVNVKNLEGTRAPARTKRIARALRNLSVAAGAFGALLLVGVSPSLGFVPGGPVAVLHILMAFAILTQAASVATSYDMWEEREFDEAEAVSIRAEGAGGASPRSH